MSPRQPPPPPRQGSLFAPDRGVAGGAEGGAEALPLQRRQLLDWQGRLARFQAPLFAAAAGAPEAGPPVQGSLWGEAGLGGAGPDDAAGPGAAAGPLARGAPPREPARRAAGLDPLALAAQHLQFWRWPSAPQAGAALYFVLDRPPHLGEQPLLLYVGETARADRRWKGAHDCKGYLAAYGEALQRAGLGSQLSIRFWGDAPAAVGPRRALEQALIQRWWPPFNKETRSRWATPFTADLD